MQPLIWNEVEGEADLLKNAAFAKEMPGRKVETKSAAKKARTGVRAVIVEGQIALKKARAKSKKAKKVKSKSKSKAKGKPKAKSKANDKPKAKSKAKDKPEAKPKANDKPEASRKGAKLASSSGAGPTVKPMAKTSIADPDGTSDAMDESDKRGDFRSNVVQQSHFHPTGTQCKV